MKKRLLAAIMSLCMIVSLLPVSAFAVEDPGTPAAAVDSVSTAEDSPVQITKTVSGPDDSGDYTLKLESYVTGKVTGGSSKPLDIVLVLDQSGSMAYDFDGESTSNDQEKRQYAMKQAVNSFIDQVASRYTTKEANHKMSIVTFADIALTRKDWTDVTPSDGALSLKSTVNNLPSSPTGATNVSAGMEKAEELINSSSKESNREKVVIVFTDGIPTTSSSYNNQIADGAVATSKTLKNNGVAVYTIGIFNDADPEKMYGTVNGTGSEGAIGYYWWTTILGEIFAGRLSEAESGAANRFLNLLSSNYPGATTDGLTHVDLGLYDSFTITENFTREEGNYYLTAATSSELDDVFQEIAESIIPSVQVGPEAVLTDTLSGNFQFSNNISAGDVSGVTVTAVPATGTGNKPTWGQGTKANVQVTIQDSTINVSGFDYSADENVVVQKDGQWQGHKLVISFPIKPDSEAEWGESGNYDTNAAAGLKYGENLKDSTMLSDSPSTYIDTYTVTYQWSNSPSGDLYNNVGNKVDSPVLPTNEKYYITNGKYTVDNTYTDTTTYYTHDEYGNVNGQYTFSGWNDPNHGVMGDQNVVITGSWDYTNQPVEEHQVIYKWEDAPTNVTLPNPITGLVKGEPYTLDTTYEKGDTVVEGGYTYTFKGWSDPNNGIMGNTDVTITGTLDQGSEFLHPDL